MINRSTPSTPSPKFRLGLVLASILSMSLSGLFGQTRLYIVNDTFQTDEHTLGSHTGNSAWQVSDGSNSVTAGISEFNYNGAASPQGGNYVYGAYQGVNNLMSELYNFTATTGTGTSYLDANANIFTNWQDGEAYEIVFWFRPIEVRNTIDDSVWAMTFDDNITLQYFSADGLDTLNTSFNQSINTTGWTELRVPVLYDVDFWEGGVPLFLAAPQFTGWTQIGGPPGGSQPNLGSPSAIYSIAIDTGVAPVPEPGGALLLGITGALLLLRRRRQ